MHSRFRPVAGGSLGAANVLSDAQHVACFMRLVGGSQPQHSSGWNHRSAGPQWPGRVLLLPAPSTCCCCRPCGGCLVSPCAAERFKQLTMRIALLRQCQGNGKRSLKESVGDTVLAYGEVILLAMCAADQAFLEANT